MRRHTLAVKALLAAVLTLAGCSKARQTPANPSGPSSCLGCHGGGGDPSGAPPFDLAGSETGGAVGAHTAHLGKQVACEECHLVPGRIADRGHLVKADGTPDADGRAEITWGARATKGGNFSASYRPAALPAKGGSCTVYCHGASLGEAGGSSTTPGWGDPPMNCGSCHGTSLAGAPPDHAPGLAVTDCAACHPETVTAGGELTTTGAHINGRIEVKGCTNCHGDDTRGEPSSEASWAPPRDAQGATTGPKVGAHLRHVSGVARLGSRLSRPFGCGECHRMPTNGGPHGQAVVQWPAASSNALSNHAGATTPSYTGGSCASTYCHGATLSGGTNKSPSWDAAGSAGCGSCHFISGPTGPHPLTDRAGIAITAATQCAVCHPGTVNADGTINVANGLHLDGLVEVDFHPAGYSNPATHGPQSLQGLGACRTCHGTSFAGLGQAPSCTQCHAAAGRPDWLTDCTFCHGQGNRAADAAFPLVGTPPVAANKAAPPVGTQREMGANQPAVGAHQAHLAPSTSQNGALTIQIQCTECHGAVLPTDEKHADGSVAIGWGPIARARGATPSPAEGNLIAGWTSNPTCTNYCHGITLGGGSKVNPNWVSGATEAACGTCHAARPGTWHPANGACGQCHPGYTGSSVNPATHVNGVVDPTGTGCTSCHGGVSGNAAPPTATTGATSGPKVGAHQAHVNASALVGAGYGCTVCHPNQTSNRHANDQVELAWTGLAVAGGVAPTPLPGPLALGAWETPGASTCTNYCHGASILSNPSRPAPLWTAAAGSLTCTSCHGAPPPLSAAVNQTHPQNTACASCHGAGYSVAGVTGAAKATHVDGSIQLVVSGCSRCHGELGAAGVTVAAPLRSAPGASGSGTNSFDTTGLATGNAVGAHRAHLVGSSGAPRWRSTAVACTECHRLPPSDADVSHATGAGTGGARATVSWGPLAGSNLLDSRLPAYTRPGCAATYCHAPKADAAAGLNPAPLWTGGPSTVVCGSCHGLPPATSSHVSGTGATACGSCHDGYASAPTSASTIAAVSATNHMDGKVDVAGASCTLCHGQATRVSKETIPVTDIFGAPLVKAAPPLSTAINQPGAHEAHLNQGATGSPLSAPLECLSCHLVPKSISHPDGVATVTFGGLAVQGASPSYDLLAHSCSSTYCHGQFPGGTPSNVVAWGTGASAATKLGCGSCHASPPAHPHPQNPTCGSCHPGSTATTVTAATHVDGTVTKTTSGCTACHGELTAAGVTVAPASNLVAAAPGATGTTSVDTVGQSAATSAGVGVHRRHLATGVIGHAAFSCAECHPVPASNTDVSHASSGAGTGGARANVLFGAIATGAVNAWSGPPVVPTYSGSGSGAGLLTGGSCASTYCHGNFTNGKKATVAWTTVGDMTCNSCHGAGTGASATLPGGTHPQGNTACGSCHTGYTNTTANPALHLNGRKDAPDSCAGCHGSPSRIAAPSATDQDGQAPNRLLVLASPPDGVTASNQVGAHLAHVNQEAVGGAGPLSSAIHCATCHVVPTTLTHSDGVTTVSWSGLATNFGAVSPAPYNATSHSCSSTYCHGQFTGGLQSNLVAWGTGSSAATKLACSACHGQGAGLPQPPHPHPQNTTCGSCHAGFTATTLTAAAAATHVDGTVHKTTSGCTACHGELPLAGVTLTVGLVSAAPGATGTNTVDTTGQAAAGAAGLGAHKAHLVGAGAGGTPRWRSTAIACIECHALPPSNTDVAHAASGTGTGGARATLAWNSLATGAVNAWFGAPLAPTYSGSTTGAGLTGGGSCASTYCHRPRADAVAGLTQAPSWTGATGTAACGSCHGLPPVANGHVTDTACGGCHPGYGNAPTSASTITAVNAANHINGRLDVGSMTCTSCHGDKALTRSVAASATWNDANGQRLVLAAPPRDATQATAGNLVGAHLAHVNQGATAPALSSALRCENCHNGLIWTTGPHATPPSPIVWGNIAIADGAMPTGYNVATKTCSNTYCHGQFAYGKTGTTIAWGNGTPAKLACNACHGQGTGVAQPPHPHPQNTACGACHPGATATTLTAAAVTTHVDGLTTRSTAGCTACHGELGAPGVTLATGTVKAAPGATGSGTNSLDTAGLAATSAAGVGAHKAHLVGTAGAPRWRAAPIACTECHALPPSDTDVSHATGVGTGGARASVVFSALSNAITFGARVPTYSGSTTGATSPGTTGGSCASTYCHAPRADTVAGLTQAPSWTGAASTAACGSCHGLPPTAAAHPANTACGTCHPGYANAPSSASTITAVNAALHINGTLDGGESSGATPCLNCHKTDTATGAAYGKMVSDTTVYHHVVAEGTTFKTYPLTATGQACLQCHADHDVFNPTLNAANTLGRGANLRTTIATAPSKVAPATGNYASTDFSGTAGICLSCHAAAIAKSTTAQKSDGSTTTHPVNGTSFAGSAHAYAVAGSISSGSSAFGAVCMKCHSDQQTASYPEKQNGTYRFALHTSVDRRLRNPMGQTTATDDRSEDHCFRCHSLTTDSSPGGGPAKAVANRDYFNAAAMTVASQNVFTAFGNTHVSRHNVAGYDLIHQPTEAPAGAGGVKHVECEDCHEPHAARAGARPASNNNLVWGPITGVTGVVPTWSTSNFVAPTGYAATSAAATEYQICFKCHSSANAGLVTWGGTGTWGGAAGTASWTDLALEFSPANQSRHPVASALPAGADTSATASNQLAASQLLAPWAPGNLMTCSDCHGADAASPAAQGPHGSAVRFMLKGTNQAWPYTQAAQNGGTTGTLFAIATSETGLGTTNGLFCRNCHPQMNSAASNAIHRQAGLNTSKHSGTNAVSACTGCHLRVPHGGKVSRLIVTTNAPARYKVGTPNLGGFTKQAKDAYTLSNSIKSSCSTHSSGTGAEAW